MARARLLVVDDEPASAEQVRAMLGDGLAEVTALSSGNEVVRTVVEAEEGGRGFDVVLLDYYM
ncbi:MAG TPA: response regulator, partial [Kofleriaceae bacterium]|nr:response regulator [Kofleriaceae bacterium]